MTLSADELTGLILLCAVLTYATRIGGHLVLARIGKIHHRLEAALNAVPVAVLTALVAPAGLAYGWPESLAMLAAGLVALRFSSFWVVLAGLLVLVSSRTLLAT